MAQQKVYVGVIQPLDETPFYGDEGKAVFAKGLEEAGEVLEAWKEVRDAPSPFQRKVAVEHLKAEVADLFMCAADCCSAMGINNAASIIRACERRQMGRGRISVGGDDGC